MCLPAYAFPQCSTIWYVRAILKCLYCLFPTVFCDPEGQTRTNICSEINVDQHILNCFQLHIFVQFTQCNTTLISMSSKIRRQRCPQLMIIQCSDWFHKKASDASCLRWLVVDFDFLNYFQIISSMKEAKSESKTKKWNKLKSGQTSKLSRS